MNRGEDELYGYYQRELDYLRNAGREFARQHPEAARRLELGELESADPHVERLLESFAFLTGRIRRDLDNEAPDMAATLLEALLPNSMAPLPPMTIVQLVADPAKGKESGGRQVAAHTPLFANGQALQQKGEAAPAQAECQFRTCYPLTLWPLALTGAVFEEAGTHPGLEREPEVAGVLRLSLCCGNGMSFGRNEGNIAPDQLRIHLHDSWHNAGALYDWLLCNVKRALVVPAGRRAADRMGEAVSWTEAGFGPDDAVLPEAGHAHPAYRQLQEYFAYPRKYLFFDAGNLAQALRGFGGAGRQEQQADLLLLVTRVPPAGLSLHTGQFLLGCTPAINLFPRTTETLRLDQRQYEYRLVPDARREATTEIHSLLKVDASYADGQGGIRLSPYYAGPIRSAVDGAAHPGQRHPRRRHRPPAVLYGDRRRCRFRPHAAGDRQRPVHQSPAGRRDPARPAWAGRLPRTGSGRGTAGALPGAAYAASHAANGRPPALAGAVATEPESHHARPVVRQPRRRRAGDGAAPAGTG
jgi:type VI secretion system protein ImpG